MDKSTFEYLKPTDAQMAAMEKVRGATKQYSDILVELVPEGPDKTYLLRKLREVAVWANIGITRKADGSPLT